MKTQTGQQQSYVIVKEQSESDTHEYYSRANQLKGMSTEELALLTGIELKFEEITEHLIRKYKTKVRA